MAIIIAKPKKREVYQIILAGIFILLFLLLLFLIFRKNLTLFSIKPTGTIHPPQINFSNLDDPLLKKLEDYPKTEEFTGILGRETPFLPSPTSSPTSSTTTLPF